MEALDDLQLNTLSQTNMNADRHKPTCHHCKKPEEYKNQCRLPKRQQEKPEGTQNNREKRNSGTNNSASNDNKNNHNNNNKSNKKSKTAKKKVKNVYPPWRHVDEQTTPRASANLESMQPKDRLHGTENHKDRFRSTKETVKTIQIKTLKLEPKL